MFILLSATPSYWLYLEPVISSLLPPTTILIIYVCLLTYIMTIRNPPPFPSPLLYHLLLLSSHALTQKRITFYHRTLYRRCGEKEGDTRPSLEGFSSSLFWSDTARQWAWFNKKSELVHAWARAHKRQASRPDQEHDPLPFKAFYDHVTDPNSPVTHEPSSWRYPVEIPVPQGFLSFDLPPP